MVKSTKIALFITITANIIVLASECEFYFGTLPGRSSHLDICSGTPAHDTNLLIVPLVVLLGIPPAIWGLSKAVIQRDRRSIVASLIAFLLCLTPPILGRTLDNYIIHAHRANISQDCR